MKKIEIDIPLEAYTDNVRRIIERSLHDLEAEPPYLTSFLCDPKLTEEDLETALHILEKAGTELTKQKLIKAELKTRREVVSSTEFPADLRQEWEDMREAVKRRKKKMEKTKTATIIPFEEAAYKEHVVEAEIVVHGSQEKPYYEIKYRKAGEADYSIGYSSYNLDIVFEFLDKYFVFDNKEKNNFSDRW